MFLKDDGKFRLIDVNEKATLQKGLEAGLYKLKIHRSPFGGISYLFKPEYKYGKGMPIKGGVYGRIQNHIDSFLSEEDDEARKALGHKKKLGLLFNGLPGTGKTFLAGQIAQRIVNGKNGLGIVTNDFKIDMAEFIDEVRKYDKDRFIVFVLDEFEKSGREEQSFLDFMDGPSSKDNIVVIATTNSKKGFKDYILERPGRFEVIYDFYANGDDVLKAMISTGVPEKYKDKLNVLQILSDVKKYANVPTIDHIMVKIREALIRYLKKPVAALAPPAPAA